MKYKALILDIDGTTVHNRPDALPTQTVITAIAQASSKVHIGVATSRSHFYAEKVIRSLNLSGPSILDGGALVVDVSETKTLVEHLISSDELEKIISILTGFTVQFYVQVPYKLYELHTPNFSSEKVSQVFCRELTHELADQIVEQIVKIPTLSVHKIPGYEKNKVWVTITSLYATKQHGIAEVAKILGIDTSEIIGVGDGYNDFPLLMACGLKIAMGNAVDELKAIADYIAPTVEEDGVAHIIEKFILTND